MVKTTFLLILMIALVWNVAAHGQEELTDDISYLDDPIFVLIGITTLILVCVAILEGLEKREKRKTKLEEYKGIIFLIIILAVASISIYILVNTIGTNVTSWSSGPVHWHADFEIWACGERIELKSPEGVSNRIGTSVFHEHGDKRIHIEGPVKEKKDIRLAEFFRVIGGDLENDHMIVPTNRGIILFENGKCPDGTESLLQGFLYKVKNPEEKKWIYEQIKLEDFENYVISPYPNVPPGDCMIIELDKEKERTDKICASYEIAAEGGELSGS